MRSRDSLDCNDTLQHLIHSLIGSTNLSLLYQALQQVTSINNPACFHNLPRRGMLFCWCQYKIEWLPIQQAQLSPILYPVGPVLPPLKCLPLMPGNLAQCATMNSLLPGIDHVSWPAMAVSIILPPVLPAHPK